MEMVMHWNTISPVHSWIAVFILQKEKKEWNGTVSSFVPNTNRRSCKRTGFFCYLKFYYYSKQSKEQCKRQRPLLRRPHSCKLYLFVGIFENYIVLVSDTISSASFAYCARSHREHCHWERKLHRMICIFVNLVSHSLKYHRFHSRSAIFKIPFNRASISFSLNHEYFVRTKIPFKICRCCR